MNKEPVEKLFDAPMTEAAFREAVMELKAEAKAAGFSSDAEYMRALKLNKEK